MKKKSLWLLLFCLIFSGTFLLAGGIEDMNGLELKFIKIPFYKDQNLQMLIFSESGRRHERYILSTNTFLDILLKAFVLLTYQHYNCYLFQLLQLEYS